MVPFEEGLTRVRTHFAPHVLPKRARDAAFFATVLMALAALLLLVAIALRIL